MADPITIISLVGGAATAGWELSKMLYQMVDTIKNGKEEVRKLAHGLSDMSEVLDSLKQAIDEAKGFYRPLFINSTTSVLEDYKDLRTEIERHIKKKRRMETLRWFWRSMKVEKPLKELEALKSTLTLKLVIMRLAADHKNDPILHDISQRESQKTAQRHRFRRVAETIIMKSRENIIELQEIKSKEERREFENQPGQLQTWRISNQMVLDKTAAWLQGMIFAPGEYVNSGEDGTRPPVSNEAINANHDPQQQQQSQGAAPFHPRSPSSVRPMSTVAEEIPRPPPTTVTEEVFRPPPTPKDRWVLPDRFWKPDPTDTMDKLLQAWSFLTQDDIQESKFEQERTSPAQAASDFSSDDSSDDENSDVEMDSLRTQAPGNINNESPVDRNPVASSLDTDSSLDDYRYVHNNPFAPRNRSAPRDSWRHVPGNQSVPQNPYVPHSTYVPQDPFINTNPFSTPFPRTQQPGYDFMGHAPTWPAEERPPPQQQWGLHMDGSNQEASLVPTKTYKDGSGNVLRLSKSPGGEKALYINRQIPRSRRTSPQIVPTTSVLLHGLASPGNSQSSRLIAQLKRRGTAIFNLDPKPEKIDASSNSEELERASVMNGSIMWEPGQYPSEFLVSCSNIGVEVIYVRGSDSGQTWFCGRKPFHVNFFNPNYVPQTSWPPESNMTSDHYLAIGREWVEMETLENQGIAFGKDHPAYYFLEPELSPDEIVEAVVHSFTLREASLRRHTRLHICGVRKAPRPLTGRGLNHFFPQSRPSTASTSSGSTLVNPSEDTARSDSRDFAKGELRPDPALQGIGM
ncbi:hypothetical protein BC567DRAFT_297285 [Phyllosticta citribraziliensis]